MKNEKLLSSSRAWILPSSCLTKPDDEQICRSLRIRTYRNLKIQIYAQLKKFIPQMCVKLNILCKSTSNKWSSNASPIFQQQSQQYNHGVERHRESNFSFLKLFIQTLSLKKYLKLLASDRCSFLLLMFRAIYIDFRNGLTPRGASNHSVKYC